jgi:dTDP-4-dehydrorhamnose 3,5-epimerase
MIRIEQLTIPVLVLIHPIIYPDDRGLFFESFNTQWKDIAGIPYDFVQDNEAHSRKDVLRGLHFQTPPWDQGKLVRVVSGSVLDLAVDIRSGSPTYGKHCAVLLSSENKIMFWIPPGFAHGYLTLEDNTIFQYKCTNFYNHASQDGIRWNDSELAINWGIDSPILSPKDAIAPNLSEFNSPFVYVG